MRRGSLAFLVPTIFPCPDESNDGPASRSLSARSTTRTYSNTKSDVELTDPTARLQAEVWHGCEEFTILSLLQEKADVNAVFQFGDPTIESSRRNNRIMGQKQGMTGTVLTVALMRGDLEVVQALLESGADMEAPYSFLAGKKKLPWCGTPVMAAIAKGRLDMVQEMAEYKADLTSLGSLDGEPNNTMLWNASYFGHAGIVRFLLASRADAEHVLNRAARNQDDPSLTHTALHIAARAGWAEVVELLIAAKAQFKAPNTHFATPFTDAIDHGHTDVVRLLAKATADVLSNANMAYLFRDNNVVTIAAVAEGLRHSPAHLVDEGETPLEIDDLVRFLIAPGSAPLHVLATVFRPRHLKYWSQSKRLEWSTAYIRPNSMFNAAIGPTGAWIQERFNQGGEEESPEERRWLDKLLHRAPPAWGWLLTRQDRSQVKEPVETLECTIPRIHHDPLVMYAIVNAANMEVLEELGCQAIIQVSWDVYFDVYCFNFAATIVMAILFVFVTGRVNVDESPAPSVVVALVLALCLGCRDVLQELGHLWGFARLQMLAYYVGFQNFLVLLQISVTTTTTLLLLTRWQEFAPARSEVVYRTFLGVTVFFRWMKVLSNLRGFESIGPRLLPIMMTMHDVLPFLTVVICPFIGFVHFYWALGVKEYFDDSFMIVYRLAFLADFDMEEMEHSDHGVTHWTTSIRALLVVIGFLMTITMMNVFIGVLSESYSRAYSQRAKLFWHSRAEVVLQSLARQQVLPCFREWSCLWRRRDSVEFETSLWYCHRKHNAQHEEVGLEERLGRIESGLQRLRPSPSQARALQLAPASGGRRRSSAFDGELPGGLRQRLLCLQTEAQEAAESGASERRELREQLSLLDSRVGSLTEAVKALLLLQGEGRGDARPGSAGGGAAAGAGHAEGSAGGEGTAEPDRELADPDGVPEPPDLRQVGSFTSRTSLNTEVMADLFAGG